MGRPPSGHRRRPRKVALPRPDSRTTSTAHAGSRRKDQHPKRAGRGWAVRPEARGSRPPPRRRPAADRRARAPMPRPAAARTADARPRRQNPAPARSPSTGAPASRCLPPHSAPPRAAPSCQSRPAPRPPRTCRCRRGPRQAPTRSAPTPRCARAAVRLPHAPHARGAYRQDRGSRARTGCGRSQDLRKSGLDDVAPKSGGSPRCEHGRARGSSSDQLAQELTFRRRRNSSTG